MNDLNQAVQVLENGGVVMHATETCYGLAVAVADHDALRKLYQVKGMAKDKPVSILVDSYGMASEYGVFSEEAFELAQKHWPGPLSILVPRSRKLPAFFNPGHEFVSIRCSSNDFCREMVKELGMPVTTTSANRTGEPQLYEAKKFDEKIDLVVDGGVIAQNQPSTIVKVEGDRIEILRQGGVVLHKDV